MSAYGLCFIACVVATHQIAEANSYNKRVAFIVDSGNPYAEHVRLAHQTLAETQSAENFLNLGALAFDEDDNVTALQAADVICWAVRRRAAGLSFANGFEPTEAILTTKGHNQSPFPEVSIRGLLAAIEAITPEILEEP